LAVAIRAAIAQFPLVASVKATLALLTGEPAWRRVMPPLSALSEAQLGALEEALAATALLAERGRKAAELPQARSA